METVVLTMDVDEKLYCPFCGHLTLTGEPFDASKSECSHLMYVAVNEGGIQYENPKFKKELEEYNESMDEDDLIAIEAEDAIHFSLCSPAPSSFGVSVGYKKSI